MVCQHTSNVLEHNCEFELTYLLQSIHMQSNNKITQKFKLKNNFP